MRQAADDVVGFSRKARKRAGVGAEVLVLHRKAHLTTTADVVEEADVARLTVPAGVEGLGASSADEEHLPPHGVKLAESWSFLLR